MCGRAGVLAVVLSLCTGACTENAAPPNGGAGGAVPGTGGALGGSGGAAGTLACDQDLSGTWDLSAAKLGDVHTGVIQIGHDSFSLSLDDGAWLLSYSKAALRAEWTAETHALHPITIQATPSGNLDFGIIPMNVGGSWVFKGAENQCAVTVSQGSIATTCTAPADELSFGGADWPRDIPEPELGQTHSFTRTSTLASSFGMLGGTWVSSPDSAGKTCQMRFEGNGATLSCNTQNDLKGSVTITLGSDCVGSGTTSTGFELSARRR